MTILLNWTQQGKSNITFQNVLKISLLSLIGLVGACSSYKPTPIPFDTATDMALHLESYKKWLSTEKSETESVNNQLSPFLKDLLYRDFSFYEKVYPSFEAYTQSYDSIKVLGTKQFRLVKSLKKRKEPDLNRKIRRGSDDTFLSLFTQNDLSIQRYQYLHDYHKVKLVELFEKQNYRCVFIRDQFVVLRPKVLELQYRKNAFKNVEDKLLNSFSNSISIDGSEFSTFVRRKIERVQAIKMRIERLDIFFEEIEILAKKEINSTLFIAPIGNPPKEYELKLDEELLVYSELLDELDIIYSN